MADVTELEKSGWFVHSAAVEEQCPGKKSADELLQALLDIDLRHVGRARVADSLWKSKSDNVDGPLVLQVQKVRNVCIPKESDDGLSGSGARLIKLILTDGQHTINALELESLPGLSTNVPPGSKLKLTGRIPICNGYLLLSRGCCTLLGGRVQNLVEGWMLKRSLASHSRDSGQGVGGPPPFIPFGDRGKAITRTPRHNDGFKSLDVGAKKKEADSEFEQQRKAIIEAALQEQQIQNNKTAANKQQQADHDIATIVEMGFNAKEATAALQQTAGNVEQALNTLLNRDKSAGAATTNGRAVGSTNEPKSGAVTNAADSLELRGKGEARSHGGIGKSDGPQRERVGGPREGRRNGRRGNQEREDDGYSRPSAPATLFDFVTSKMPLSSSSQVQDTKDSSQPPVPTESDNSAAADSKTGPRTASTQPLPAQHHPPAPAAQLPPRLQRKQRQVEEEKFMKYYKPMEYMRQSNFNHGSASGGGSGSSSNNNTSSGASAAPKPESAPAGRAVHDIHSRGTVRNKTLWTDSDMGVGKNDRQRGPKENESDVTPSASGDIRKSNQDRTNGRSRESDKTGRSHGERSVTWADHEGQQTGRGERELESGLSSLSLQTSSGGTRSADGSGSARHSYAVAHNSGPRQNSRQSASNGSRQWKVGDECMAKYWQDKQYYKAVIKSVSAQNCSVLFIDYGNTENVSFGDIAELPNQGVSWDVYNPSTAAVTQYPPTNAGQNVVYQPVAAAAGTHGMYYTQPYVTSAYPNAVFDPATGQGVLVPAPTGAAPVQQAASTTAVPGILIQGPPPSAHQSLSMYPQSRHYIANDLNATADGRTGAKPKRTQQQQQQMHYVPPAMRK